MEGYEKSFSKFPVSGVKFSVSKWKAIKLCRKGGGAYALLTRFASGLKMLATNKKITEEQWNKNN